jgi:hypothetical protein
MSVRMPAILFSFLKGISKNYRGDRCCIDALAVVEGNLTTACSAGGLLRVQCIFEQLRLFSPETKQRGRGISRQVLRNTISSSW